MKRLFAAGLMAVVLSGCGQGEAEKAKALQDEVTRLHAEVDALKTQLDEERNGAPRLLARGRDELAGGELGKAKQTFLALVQRRPESAEAAQAKGLIQQIDGKLAAIEAQKRLAQS